MKKWSVASPTKIPRTSCPPKFSRCSGSAAAYVQPTYKGPVSAFSVVRAHLTGGWVTGVGTRHREVSALISLNPGVTTETKCLLTA